MAQLPPKVPNMATNWADFPHKRMASMENLPPPSTAAAAPQNASWVDEFFNFAAAKRGSHRRSASDSVAFFESSMVEECRRLSGPASKSSNSGFDRFDDEQLMSMFADDDTAAAAAAVGPTASSSNVSDQNSIPPPGAADQQLKHEPEEVESSCKSEGQGSPDATTENSTDRIVDPKRIKRILANRQSAQRSRVRKLQYISELERNVTSLQSEVSVLSPRVAFLDHQRLVMTVDNSNLKQRIAALAQDKIFKEAHQEALKREIERLRKVYQEQNDNKMENETPHSEPNGSVEEQVQS